MLQQQGLVYVVFWGQVRLRKALGAAEVLRLGQPTFCFTAQTVVPLSKNVPVHARNAATSYVSQCKGLIKQETV